MNLAELKTLIGGGESDRVEFKRSTGQRTEAMKTVCAMLNGLGGFVLFGVSDLGEIIGQQVSAHTLEEVVQELRRIEPPAFPDIETVALENGNPAIALRVPGGGGPYTYDGRPYMRTPACAHALQPASCHVTSTRGGCLNGCTLLTDGRTARRRVSA
jgi:ATP-dependent DNA helicase RecG